MQLILTEFTDHVCLSVQPSAQLLRNGYEFLNLDLSNEYQMPWTYGLSSTFSPDRLT